MPIPFDILTLIAQYHGYISTDHDLQVLFLLDQNSSNGKLAKYILKWESGLTLDPIKVSDILKSVDNRQKFKDLLDLGLLHASYEVYKTLDLEDSSIYDDMDRLFENSIIKHYFDIASGILKPIDSLSLPKGLTWWLNNADPQQLEYLTKISVLRKVIPNIENYDDAAIPDFYQELTQIVDKLYDLGLIEEAIDIINSNEGLVRYINIEVLQSFLTYDENQRYILHEAANETLAGGRSYLDYCADRIRANPSLRDSVKQILREYDFTEEETVELFG